MDNNNKISRIDQNDEIGDNHLFTTIETPLRADAFKIDDELKIELIEKNFREIMHILGMDLNDESLKDTPGRVAKMYVKEVFSGLNPENKPKTTIFNNNFKFKEMLVERDITIYSYCEHHFVRFLEKLTLLIFQMDTLLDYLNLIVLHSIMLKDRRCRKDLQFKLLMN